MSEHENHSIIDEFPKPEYRMKGPLTITQNDHIYEHFHDPENPTWWRLLLHNIANGDNKLLWSEIREIEGNRFDAGADEIVVYDPQIVLADHPKKIGEKMKLAYLEGKKILFTAPYSRTIVNTSYIYTEVDGIFYMDVSDRVNDADLEKQKFEKTVERVVFQKD